MPPTFVPGSPVTLSITSNADTVSMIFSAPAEIPTVFRRFPPVISIFPAGIVRALTSPFGVFMTTAERFPIKARATGTIFLVASESRSKTVAIPYGFDN